VHRLLASAATAAVRRRHRRGAGALTVQIVDAPTPKYEEVVVTITRITAHSPVDGWVVISDAPATLDLLKLKDVGFVFGKADLSPGRITQLRLYTDPAGPQYVTLADGSRVDLKVPSGPQSGIKIKAQLDLAACEETTITLDFMPQKSIHVHPTGDGDLWILRPVIKTKGVVASAIGCETRTPATATASRRPTPTPAPTLMATFPPAHPARRAPSASRSSATTAAAAPARTARRASPAPTAPPARASPPAACPPRPSAGLPGPTAPRRSSASPAPATTAPAAWAGRELLA
jgi:hypothetical protein